MNDAKNAVTRPHDEGRTVPGAKRRGERLIGLLVAGIALLNFPFLSIFSVRKFFFGVPVLYVYIFSVWICLIAVMAAILRDRPKQPPPDSREKKD